MKAKLVLIAVLVAGLAVVSAQAQQPTENPYALKISPSRLVYLGSFLDEVQCKVKDIIAGKCEALNTFYDLNNQVKKQNDETNAAGAADFEKRVRDKLAAEAKAEADKKAAEAETAKPKIIGDGEPPTGEGHNP